MYTNRTGTQNKTNINISERKGKKKRGGGVKTGRNHKRDKGRQSLKRPQIGEQGRLGHVT